MIYATALQRLGVRGSHHIPVMAEKDSQQLSG